MVQNIGKTVKLVRTRRDLTQRQLAAKAGLSMSYLSLVEQSKRTPSLEALEHIAEALGVPMNILVFLSSDLSQLEDLDQNLAERLSFVAWKLIEARDDHASVPQ